MAAATEVSPTPPLPMVILVKGGLHHLVADEGSGLLGEVVLFDVNALALEPVNVRREAHELGIDRGVRSLPWNSTWADRILGSS
jgi:hypothetical protein